MEQLSKSGNAVRESMRSSLRANQTSSLVRVSKRGNAYIQTEGSREYGLRSPHSFSGLRGAKSMANFITSFLMEETGTLIVGGANPRFIPILRRGGKVVGRGSPQQAVSAKAIAILHRMDTGKKNADYDETTELNPNARPRNFMMTGIRVSKGKVDNYLKEGYISLVDKSIRKNRPKIRKVG
jgi:hypothetical protein